MFVVCLSSDVQTDSELNGLGFDHHMIPCSKCTEAECCQYEMLHTGASLCVIVTVTMTHQFSNRTVAQPSAKLPLRFRRTHTGSSVQHSTLSTAKFRIPSSSIGETTRREVLPTHAGRKCSDCKHSSSSFQVRTPEVHRFRGP